MKPVRVVPSIVWRNKINGRRASIYGSVPWVADAEKVQWEKVQTGWTLEMSNGTIGYGAVPLATKAEAEAVMDKWLKRIGAK